MKKTKRAYISLYFEDGLVGKRKKRDLTISFNPNDPLYLKCHKIGSAKIKEIIGINLYSDLVGVAKKENRTLGNYIKHKLSEKIGSTSE
jgi:hypothetical protein